MIPCQQLSWELQIKMSPKMKERKRQSSIHTRSAVENALNVKSKMEEKKKKEKKKSGCVMSFIRFIARLFELKMA